MIISMKLQTRQQGYTLIELMVAMVIVGTLSTTAIPAYSNYVNKAKFTEVIAATGPIKAEIGLCYVLKGDIKLCDDTTLTGGVGATDGKVAAAVARADAVEDLFFVDVRYHVIQDHITVRILGPDEIDNATYLLEGHARPGGSMIWNERCIPASYC